MEKRYIIEWVNYLEDEVIRLKDGINSLTKFNIDVYKIENAIQNYEALIAQFNKKLLNSSYEIDQGLLAFILEDFVTEADLLQNSDLRSKNIKLIGYLYEEFRRNNTKSI